MYKAIFCDLDNTLLNKDKLISKENIEAIKYADSKGCKFLVSSGRLPFCIKMFEGQLDLGNAITTNGCIIYKDGQIVKQECLDNSDARAILDYGIKHNEYERIFTQDYLYLLHIEKGGEDAHYYEDSEGISEENAYRLINENKIYKMSFYGERSHLIEIKKELETLNLNISITFSSPKLLECIKNSQSKAKGIIDYLELSGIDIKDTIGIGDSENDKEMLEICGISSCPSNSEQEIKNICDYVSPLSNDESAVAQIIKKYIK